MCHPFPVLHCHPRSCPLPSLCSLNTLPHPPSSIPAQASPSPIPPFSFRSFALCPSTLEMLLVAQSKSLPEEQWLVPPPSGQGGAWLRRSVCEAAQTWEEKSIAACSVS
uniref:Uncharacterized protein n=1 Tax=Saimiri boliviensis boliviensis TaxID=39432 RepID=A0A2K6SDN5_SAIBB